MIDNNKFYSFITSYKVTTIAFFQKHISKEGYKEDMSTIRIMRRKCTSIFKYFKRIMYLISEVYVQRINKYILSYFKNIVLILPFEVEDDKCINPELLSYLLFVASMSRNIKD